MSKQLALASAFSVFALAAMALLAPGSARISGALAQEGATTAAAAPHFAVIWGEEPELPFPG